MPYNADISRANPACFLFLVDQSGSMEADIGGQGGARKADQAADAINRIVDTLSQRCSSGMDVRDYFHIGILGYTSVGWLFNGDKPEITSALPGTTPERPFLPISQVVEVAEIEEKRVTRGLRWRGDSRSHPADAGMAAAPHRKARPAVRNAEVSRASAGGMDFPAP